MLRGRVAGRLPGRITMKYCIPTIRLKNSAFELVTCEAPTAGLAYAEMVKELGDTHAISLSIVPPDAVADWAGEAESDEPDYTATA